MSADHSTYKFGSAKSSSLTSLNLRSDPFDHRRKIVRGVAEKQDNWVSISDEYGSINIFVPNGYSWVESDPKSDPIEFDSKDFGPVRREIANR